MTNACRPATILHNYRMFIANSRRGRKSEADSISRVSGTDIEQAVIKALRERLKIDIVLDADVIGTYVARAEVSSRSIKITTAPAARIRTNFPSRANPVRLRCQALSF